MADHSEDALIREVNDDLREEQMMMLWKRYGSYIFGAAVLVILIVAGYQGWKRYDLSQRAQEGDSFYSASLLAQSGNMDKALEAFGQITQNSSNGYGVLAAFKQAALMAVQGDAKGAALIYQKIARDATDDVAISGLANILGVMLEMNTPDYDAAGLRLRLLAISGDGYPYRYSARELLALIDIKTGNPDKALELFTNLSNDSKAPKGIRGRAKNLISYLGG